MLTLWVGRIKNQIIHHLILSTINTCNNYKECVYANLYQLHITYIQ